MPDRFWVGGTGSWDGTAGTKWSATSGGPGGASVPGVVDDVFFNAASNTGSPITVTIAAGNTGARSINCTGFTRTIGGTANISVAGSVTLTSGMVWSHIGVVSFIGTGTLTTAGRIFSGINVSGAGITLTLGDALNVTSAGAITVTQGTFNTANFSVAARGITSSNTNARTITLGSSTLAMVGSPAIDFTTSTNLTFNAGTSQINISSSSVTISGGSRTFNNVSFTSTFSGSRIVSGINIFNNLTLVAPSTAGVTTLGIAENQTVNGTFTCAGATALRRCALVGGPSTVTAATVSAADCDFRDITIAGAAAPISPTRAGDCGGNSGITFPSAKTVFRVGTNTTWGGASSWALTSNGTGSDNNFPLPQDTAILDNVTPPNQSVTVGDYNIGNINASARTVDMALPFASFTSHFGSITLGSGVTVSGTGTQTFVSRGTQTFTSAGRTITFPVTVDKLAGAFELGDAYLSSAATNSIQLIRGVFNARNFNVTVPVFVSNNTNTRTLTMGSGLWTLSGTGVVWNLFSTTGLTFNRGTSNILLSNTTTSGRTFEGGGLTYNRLTIGGVTGTSSLTMGGANSFAELASSKTVAHTIQLNSILGTIDTWSITGTAGNVVTLNSRTAGTRRTFNLTNETSGINFLSVRDIGVNQANRFFVGPNSTNDGNNLNVIFSNPGAQAASTGNFFMLFS